MYTGMDTVGDHAKWYFISHIVLITILFSQLLIGILFNAFSLFLLREKEAHEQSIQMRKAGMIDYDLLLTYTIARANALQDI